MSDTDSVAAGLAAVLSPEFGTDVSIVDLQRLSAGANRETWRFDAVANGKTHELVMQRDRAGVERLVGTCAREARVLRCAAANGVPVAEVVVSADVPNPLERSFSVNRRIEGETIARRILRDDEWAIARDRFVTDSAAALAKIHAITLDESDDLDLNGPYDALDSLRDQYVALDDPHPAFDLGFRWLDRNRPDPLPTSLVHGDFRLGNLMLGHDGLRAALDWEITHFGDPGEDLGWLCVRAWRFGGPQPVGGMGSYQELIDAYHRERGILVPLEALRWWETYGTLRWGVICMQMSGDFRARRTDSVEMATIGRRVVENEYDLLELLP